MFTRAVWLACAALLVGNSCVIAADEPLIVAHRGASHDAPENTMPAFLLAWERGADAIEGDFYLTSDGKIVCCHDTSTKRYANRDLVVKESTLAELQSLDVGKWKAEQYTGTQMPTLPDVLACVPDGKRVYVEVKCGPEIVPTLIHDFAASGLADKQIIVIAFNADVIAAVKQAAPQYKAYWLSSFKEQENGTMTPTIKTVLRTLKAIKADGFSSSKDGVTDTLIEQVEELGYEYHVWTVDDAPTANRFRQWGANSITTNRPKFVRDALKSEAPATKQAL